MLYSTQFETDQTKSFTNVAFNNIKALQLQRINFELRPIGSMLNWDQAPSWLQSSKDYFAKTMSNNKASLVHLPINDLLKSHYKSKNYGIAYTTFETTMLPQWLVEALSQNFKGMIVPSKFNKEALIRSGLTIPVEVVPHALLPIWLKDPMEKPFAKPENTYVFGYVGNWNPRKNPRLVLETYIRAFPNPKESKTALLLKTFNAGNLQDYILHLTNGEPRDDIWIYDEQWQEAQVYWAFNVIDCYVSAHKGEGFGLTLAQAAALGKPVIYTDFSAPTEWLSFSKGHFPIRYTLESVKREDVSVLYENLISEELQWAEVDADHLCETLKLVASQKRKKGFSSEQLKEFRDFVSWEAVGERLVEAIENILHAPLERLETDESKNT